MKKLGLLLALIMIFSLFSACSKDDDLNPTDPPTTGAPPTTEPATTEPATTTEPSTRPDGIEYECTPQSYDILDGAAVIITFVSTGYPTVEAMPSIEEYYIRQDSDLKEYMLLLQDQAIAAKGSSTIFIPYSIDMSYDVHRRDDKVFSVMHTMYDYTGGAHEGETIGAENFLVPSGDLLTLPDLFTVEKDVYYPKIKEEVIKVIRENGLEESLFSDSLENLMELFEPKNFCLKEDGIAFFWQVYELTSYAGGSQVFTVPYSAFGDIINPDLVP